MFQVPEIFLEKLKCSLCDGYLNAKPVVVKDGKQICAKCYKILPHDEKEQCVREISFEAIGSCLVFPCRYHKMGCDYTFTWNNENGHESECKKRYFTFPDIVTANKHHRSYEKQIDKVVASDSQESDDSYSSKYGKIASNALIKAEKRSGTTNLAFKNDGADENPNAIHLNLLGTVHFQNNANPPYEELNNNYNSTVKTSLYENIYSTIPSATNVPVNTYTKDYCLNCNALVEKRNKNTCLFGHLCCNNCKEDMCVVCVKNLDGLSRITCKNASRGCQQILQQGDVGFHRDNCEYNEISCPIENCDKKDVLEKIKNHLKEDHSDKIILASEVSKSMGQKDQILVFLYNQGIFKCLYYYYGTSVEIMLVYLGPCAKAQEYDFEVSVEVNKKTLKKTLGCANWNNYMLASGINFDKKELLNFGAKKLNSVFSFKINRARQV